MTHPLTYWRKANSLTLEDLGALIGATKGMISKWEACKTMPRAHFLVKIHEVTQGQVTATDFVNAFNGAVPEAAE